jgi:hypothetical protein
MSDDLITTNEYDKQTLENFDRTTLLPHLFKIKGKPFSLDKYPQMRAIYANKFVPKTIYFCGRQVSKSTNLSRSEVFDAISIEQFQQLFIAPLQDQTLRYSRGVLQEAINTCRTAKLMQSKKFAAKHGSGGIDITSNITNKTFSNGASIQHMPVQTRTVFVVLLPTVLTLMRYRTRSLTTLTLLQNVWLTLNGVSNGTLVQLRQWITRSSTFGRGRLKVSG